MDGKGKRQMHRGPMMLEAVGDISSVFPSYIIHRVYLDDAGIMHVFVSLSLSLSLSPPRHLWSSLSLPSHGCGAGFIQGINGILAL